MTGKAYQSVVGKFWQSVDAKCADINRQWFHETEHCHSRPVEPCRGSRCVSGTADVQWCRRSQATSLARLQPLDFCLWEQCSGRTHMGPTLRVWPNWRQQSRCHLPHQAWDMSRVYVYDDEEGFRLENSREIPLRLFIYLFIYLLHVVRQFHESRLLFVLCHYTSVHETNGHRTIPFTPDHYQKMYRQCLLAWLIALLLKQELSHLVFKTHQI